KRRPVAKARRPVARARRPKAKSADILPSAQPQPRIPSKWRQQYANLKRLRDDLLQRQNGLNRDAVEQRPNFSTHMADAGTDTFDRDFALGMLSSEQDAVYEIEEAIKRIENRNYGICEVTGKPIAPERLAAIPWTR